MRLFHVSEEPDITVFEPRPPPSPDVGVTSNAVWALGEYHLPHYLLPRDCPRIALHVKPHTSEADRTQILGSLDIQRLMIVEEGWKQRIAETPLFIYEFSPESFELCDANAGYYISRQTIRPVARQTINDCFTALADHGIELRFLPNLCSLRDKVLASTIGFSMMRMRNAQPMAG